MTSNGNFVSLVVVPLNNVCLLWPAFPKWTPLVLMLSSTERTCLAILLLSTLTSKQSAPCFVCVVRSVTRKVIVAPFTEGCLESIVSLFWQRLFAKLLSLLNLACIRTRLFPLCVLRPWNECVRILCVILVVTWILMFLEVRLCKLLTLLAILVRSPTMLILGRRVLRLCPPRSVI